MASLSESVATKPKNSIGETYARKVLSDWEGTHVVDACIAATQIGLIHSGGALGDERARQILREEFDSRKIDDVNWSVVIESFRNGRSAVINPTQLRERFHPAAVNDNKPKPASDFAAFLNMAKERAGTSIPSKDRFQVTWFDDVDQSAAKEEIVQGVLGAGEFSLFVAKPGTAKSVLVGDIGCHITAGMDWHGRKVKQGLVVFFAAERKKLTGRRVAAWRKKHGVTNIPFAVVGGKLDMTTGLIDAKALAKTIADLEAKSRHKCVLIILDTVTRTFGPGDQHQSRDMARYVESIDELIRTTRYDSTTRLAKIPGIRCGSGVARNARARLLVEKRRQIPCRDSRHADGTISVRRNQIRRRVSIDRLAWEDRLFAERAREHEFAGLLNAPRKPERHKFVLMFGKILT